ncbi:hypothetical protein Tco_0684203 [Tanacetum coccineum]
MLTSVGDENPIRTLGDYSRPSHKGYQNTIEIPDGYNVVPLRSDTIRLVQNGCSFHGLRSEDPNQHLNDFLKFVDSLDLDVANKERTCLRLFQFSLRDQASNWLERLPARSISIWEDVTTLTRLRPENVNSTSPSLTARSYPTKDPHCSSQIHSSINAITIHSKQPNKSRNDQPQDHDTFAEECETSEEEGKEEKGDPENTNTNPPSSPDPSIPFITEKVRTKDEDHHTMVEVEREHKKSEEEEEREEKGEPENINTNPPSPPDPSISLITEKVYVMFIELNKKYNDPCKEEFGEDEGAVTGEVEVEYFDTFPTRSELAYHKYLTCGPIPSIFLRNPIIVGGCPSNLKIPCNIGHVHVEKAYIDLNSPLNVMTHMQYNWIMRKQLEPKEDPEGIIGVSNFIGRTKGMHIFIGNFTYVSDFMIVGDISSIIDPRLSQVVLGKPFIEISNMTHGLSEGVVKFTKGTNEIAYKMPYKIEQYNSLLDLEKSIRSQSTLGTRRIREEE